MPNDERVGRPSGCTQLKAVTSEIALAGLFVGNGPILAELELTEEALADWGCGAPLVRHEYCGELPFLSKMSILSKSHQRTTQNVS